MGLKRRIVGRSSGLRFEVGAGVIFALGRDLITDSSQAVMELVKNSYDADSAWVEVDIRTNLVSEDPRFAGAEGYIRVDDGGVGMTLEQIRRGWLTIARSPKREFKALGKTTGKGRTPLGDKGHGRLGAQALGRYLKITTRPAGQLEQISVWIDWVIFSNEINLSSVRLDYVVEPRPVGSKDGTTILVCGLWDPATWSTGGVKDLQGELTRLISPFARVPSFVISVHLNGQKVDLMEMSARVREHAATTYSFEFDGEQLSILGKAKLQYCRPNPPKKTDREAMHRRFAGHVSSDGGALLAQWLAASSRKKTALAVVRSSSIGWFVEARTTLNLADVRIKGGSMEPISNPGPFEGALDTFVLSDSSEGGESLGLPNEIRQIVKDIRGIRVYRNGFGIKLNDDWLGMAKSSSSGGSFFELKLESTVGYVALTAAGNARLEETADRQRFNEDSPAFRTFRGLLIEVLKFIGEFQEHLRRGTTAFLRAQKERALGAESSPDRVVGKRMDKFVEDAGAHRAEAERASNELAAMRMKLADAIEADKGQEHRQDQSNSIFGLVESATKQAQEALSAIDVFLKRAEEMADIRTILVERLEAVNEHMSLVLETAGLGLAAEVLSHEVALIASGLADRSSLVLPRLQQARAESYIVRFVEHVRGQATALRRQLSHLAPALRYVREHREKLDVGPFLVELSEYHRPRLERATIKLELEDSNQGTFVVDINRGKLVQVLDNLIVNSEYWVLEGMRRYSNVGVIHILVVPPFIRVRDSGPGVDPAIEEALFEAFVTRKQVENVRGRGLGLFISRRLLEADGCGLNLTDHRNSEGRLDTFEIDLSGVWHVQH